MAVSANADLFPEIWGNWSFKKQPKDERPEGSLIERTERAVSVLKKLDAWRGGEMWLWPTRRLEEFADEMRERADMNRGKSGKAVA